MKMVQFAIGLILSCILFSCEDEKNTEIPPFTIPGISLETYPFVDCSTSAGPLQTLIACKLLDYPYQWMQNLAFDNIYHIFPDYQEVNDIDTYLDKIKVSGTNGAYINLINKEADLIIVARKASPDEVNHAKKQKVSLIETPIALDAFIFITNKENEINSLTTEQIQQIYMGKITNWKEVGGDNQSINPYVRDANSGSQELMDELVMKDLSYGNWPVEPLSGMMGPFYALQNDKNGICYTVYYYKEFMVRESNTRSIAVNNIYPDKKTLKDNSYPYVTEVYAVIRKDLDKSSAAYQLYERLTKGSANSVIEESGYIPYN